MNAPTSIGSMYRRDSAARQELRSRIDNPEPGMFGTFRLSLFHLMHVTCPFHNISLFFLLWRVFSPASLLSLLLFMAGIELNPGPKIWICSVCNKQIRKTHASVRCNICNNWCHFLACSGLSDLGSYNNTFVASCCLGAASSSSSVSDSSPFASPIASSHSSSHYNTPISSPHLSPPRLQSDIMSISPESFRVLQWNCNGLRNKLPEITDFMFRNDIKIAAIQETKIPPSSSLSSFNGYHILRRDRTDRGGGLAFVLHHDVTFRQISPLPSSDSHLEYMSIIVQTGKLELTLTNVYIPPVNSIGAHYHPYITHLLQGESTIIMGNVNAFSFLNFPKIIEVLC